MTIIDTWTAYAPTTSESDSGPANQIEYPVDPEVIDSPACSMPQYAGYPTKFFYVGSSAYPAVSADTYQQILAHAQGVHGRTQQGYRIVRVPIAPNGKPVGFRQSDKVWVGQCGSHIWFVDQDRSYQQFFKVMRALGDGTRYIQTGSLSSSVGTSQAWWINGVSDKHPELDGFYVECSKKTTRSRHEGLCGDAMFEWDWRDYCPWTDQGHLVQPTLF